MTFEIVERKGKGHPDTICDSIVNMAAESLENKYLEMHDRLFHYNLDKAFLVAGQTDANFGVKKKREEPMILYIGDRATKSSAFDLNEIIKEAAYEHFEALSPLFSRYDLMVVPVTRGGSASLAPIFDNVNRPANDTSVTVGYAPLTPLERAMINSQSVLDGLANRHPEFGADTKIMAVLDDESCYITVACAMIGMFISCRDEYFEAKEALKDIVYGYFRGALPDVSFINVYVNTLDDLSAQGVDGIYLTNLGLSAESGDSGQVGRGNNVKGFIPASRPVSAEADAGKNSFSHIGKIYNRAGFKIAETIWEEMNVATNVWLVSRIGDSIFNPRHLKIKPTQPCRQSDLESMYKIGRNVIENIDNIPMFS